MGNQFDKAVQRLKSEPKDYTYNELKSLLEKLGYKECTCGKTSGSRVYFMNEQYDKISLHKNHAKKTIQPYVVRYVKEHLEEKGMI